MTTLLTRLDAIRPLPVPDPDLWDEIDRTIAERMALHWVPPPQVSIEEWFRHRLKITAGQSSNDAGMPLDLAKNPQSRIILDFLADPNARELNIMKSSAGGISTTAIAACIEMIERDPGNVLYLIGNAAEARKISTVYFRPFLRQTFGEVADEKHQATLHFKINGVEIFIGSPTEDQLRSKQIKYLIEDESDTMEDVLAGGAQDLDVAEEERTKNARGSKIIRLCCPLFEYDPKAPKDVPQPQTRIHRHYLRGDQREFRCPCPRCGIEWPIEREHFDYDHCRDLAGELDLDRVADETVWRCPSCQHAVADNLPDKILFFNRGRHVPTAKAVSKTVWSAKVTDLAVLFGKASSWGFVESALLQAERESDAKFAGACRSHLAKPRPREKENASRTVDALMKHCSTYERGFCPIVPWVVVLAADVQKNASYFPWGLGAFNARGDCFVLDWGEAMDPDELEAIRRKPIPVKLERWTPELETRFPDRAVPPVYATHCVIDSGHRAKGEEVDVTGPTVYKFCHRAGMVKHVVNGVTEYRYRWVPVKGRGYSQIETLIQTSRATISDSITIPLLLFNDPAFKSELYHIQLAYDPTPGAPESEIQTKARELPRILFPRWSPDVMLEDGQIGYAQFLDELTAERYGSVMQRNRFGGGTTEVRRWYVPSGLRNNFGDVLKMLKVAHASLPKPA